jgi:choline dehydrogenase-like flavoprotein
VNDDQRATLKALVDTFVPAIEVADDPTGFWATPASALMTEIGIELYLSTLDAELQAGLEEILDGLGSFGFAHQPLAVREVMVKTLASVSDEAALGVRAYQQLSTLLAYTITDEEGRNPFWAGMGYPGAAGTPPQVEKPIPITPVEGPLELTADAVIVGSGSGGGVIAAELAAAGKDVVVVEMGGYYNESDFVQSELWAWQSLYYRGGYFTTADQTVSIVAGSSLGGGTTINWSNSVPPRADVRERWASEHGLDGVDGPEFDSHVEAVMARMKVNDKCSDFNGPHQRLAEGAAALGWDLRPATLNLDPEAYDPAQAGYTGYGDATGAKQGGIKTWLVDAARSGARILVRTAIDRILVEDGKAVGVTGTFSDPATGASHPVTVRAPIVVAACGALETPALLLRSRIGGPAVGKYLRLHPVGALFGRFDEPQEPWWGPTQAAILHEFDRREDGHGFIIEGTHFHTGLSAASVPWTSGREHKELMARFPYVSTLIHITQDRGHGTVSIDDRGRAVHTYPLDDELDRRNFLAGLAATARLLDAAGALEIASLVAGAPSWERGDDLEAWIETVSAAPLRVGGNQPFSAHQMGSARMGRDPETSVADTRGQLHDTPGVWIGDTSAFPTCSAVNPMVSCMALARRTAHAILADS